MAQKAAADDDNDDTNFEACGIGAAQSCIKFTGEAVHDR